MTTKNKLNELLILCGINNIVFTYQKEEGGNYINFNEPEKKTIFEEACKNHIDKFCYNCLFILSGNRRIKVTSLKFKCP